MFKIRDRVQPEQVLTVYAVSHAKNDTTLFLVYDKDIEDWSWVNAKYYEPMSLSFERRNK